MQMWDLAKSMKKELVQVKHKPEIVELGCTGAELDWSTAKDAREML